MAYELYLNKAVVKYYKQVKTAYDGNSSQNIDAIYRLVFRFYKEIVQINGVNNPMEN